MKYYISNNDNVIDSRDVIKRVEELESELQAEYDDLVEEFDALAEAYAEDDTYEGKFNDYLANDDESKWFTLATNGVLKDFDEWLDLVAADSDHSYQDEAVEYKELKAVADQGEGYGDWSYGESLINESYFQRYAEELAEEIGAVNRNASWPNNYIDWEQAAKELQQDYTSIDYAGTTFFMRA